MPNTPAGIKFAEGSEFTNGEKPFFTLTDGTEVYNKYGTWRVVGEIKIYPHGV